MPHVVLNGRAIELPDAPCLGDALRAVGVSLPLLCHDERLEATGACRACLVRIAGLPRAVPACATRAFEGMVIETDTQELSDARTGVLELLAARYPAGAVSAFPDKPFHLELSAHGVTAGTYAGAHDPDLVDRSHPYIAVDMNRCIQCGRCVRICAEVQGQFVWHIRERGVDTRIAPDGADLLSSSCVSCGACVDTCPTGALEDAAAEAPGPPAAWTQTVCPYCGTGCELEVGTRDGRIVAMKPVRHSAVSKGHLCVKGRYAFEYVGASDRVTEPMIREHGRWRAVSWSEALTAAAEGLRRVIDRYGADAIGILGSARATNEDNYLTQKFARTVVGTNNVDCCARVCHAPSSTALKRMLGVGLSTNSFDDIERAGLILVCGANPTENHPVIGARIKQAVRRRGARLIVIDPRQIELVSYADIHLRVKPGANVPLLNAMANVIVRERLVDDSFIRERVDDYEAFVQFIREWPPERVADWCGVEADAIRQAARLFASTRPAMIVNGLGATEHVQGTDGVSALINLALLTGNLGKQGAGVNALRGQNNVQGAAHMGCEPGSLPGSTPIENGRSAFEALWGTNIPRQPGLHQIQMMEAAAGDRLKGLVLIGYDILLTNPNARKTAAALGKVEFLVIQDLFLNETAKQFGSVFLPACSSFEKDGTFMNAERRVQRVRRALNPLGASRPDWQIVCDLAAAMRHPQGFAFPDPESVWDEVRKGCEGARGMPYARLEHRGLQWPCPDETHPGTAILHVDTFGSGNRASLRRLEFVPTPEQTTPEYPFILNTGRTLYAFNAGTMTGRGQSHKLRPTDVLDISPDDAAAADFREGDRARVISRYGAALLPVHISRTVRNGELFATFHTAGVLLNTVTSSNADSETGTPEYKVTAVRIEKG